MIDSKVSQQTLDEEIASYVECIRKLNEAKNALAPVNQLPSECLHFIFSFVSGDTDEDSRSVFPRYSFSHVSVRWRSVALNSSNLWKVLPPSEYWATLILERSKNENLFLDSGSFSCWSEEFQNNFVETVLTFRVRTLSVLTTQIKKFALLPESSLRLHALELVYQDQDQGQTFPINLVNSENLQMLSVQRSNYRWFSLSFTALTVLRVDTNHCRPGLGLFLEVLRRLSTLRVLDMKNSLPIADQHGGDSNSVIPVVLPNLEFLQLESLCNAKEVTNTLFHIIVPSSVTLRLHCADDDPAHAKEVKSSLSRFFGRMIRQGTTALYEDLSVTVTSSRLRIIGCKPGECFPSLQLEMPVYLHWLMLSKSLHLSVLSSLRLDWEIDRIDCEELSCRLPLHTLKLMEVTGHALFEDTDLVFSSLKYLTIRHLKLGYIYVLRSWLSKQSNVSQLLSLKIFSSDILPRHVMPLLKYTSNLVVNDQWFSSKWSDF